MRNKRPIARNKRNPTCGTRLGTPLIERTSSAARDRMQPISAAFKAKTVGFCKIQGNFQWPSSLPRFVKATDSSSV